MKFVLKLQYVLIIILFFACSDDGVKPVKDKYTENGNPAIVFVVENDNMLGYEIEIGYQVYKDEVLSVFEKIFGVPKEDMKDLELVEIVDIYGEEWMIDELTAVAEAKYNKICILTDETAKENNLLDTLQMLSEDDYDIDIIFCLHGSANTIHFYQSSQYIGIFTDKIIEREINIRALYQTNCHGSKTIDDWEKTDILAVNGSKEVNSIVLFAPFYFLEEWTNGKSYEDAVLTAFNREVEKYNEYNSPELPISIIFSSSEVLSDSEQYFGGSDPRIYWNNFLNDVLL